MKSIGEIKSFLQAASIEELPLFVKEYETDERGGVQKLMETARKRMMALEKEKVRIEKLREYAEKQTNVFLVLNTPANNPTGYNVKRDEWEAIMAENETLSNWESKTTSWR